MIFLFSFTLILDKCFVYLNGFDKDDWKIDLFANTSVKK